MPIRISDSVTFLARLAMPFPGGLGPDRTERLELAARVDIPLRGPPRLPGKSELEHAKTSIAIPDLIPRCRGSRVAQKPRRTDGCADQAWLDAGAGAQPALRRWPTMLGITRLP